LTGYHTDRNRIALRAVSIIRMDRAQYARATDELERLKRLYAKAVSRLFDISYRVTDSEYRKLKTFTEDVRIDLEIARREVQEASANVTLGQWAGLVDVGGAGRDRNDE
jgi:glutamine synthetase type III